MRKRDRTKDNWTAHAETSIDRIKEWVGRGGGGVRVVKKGVGKLLDGALDIIVALKGQKRLHAKNIDNFCPTKLRLSCQLP